MLLELLPDLRRMRRPRALEPDFIGALGASVLFSAVRKVGLYNCQRSSGVGGRANGGINQLGLGY
ncbi:hypothetical protein D3H35_16255 [Cohnella faecalis]|uniref:Uncharacterized protein n=1 Tax=Cohnella faecalis TaxID=2315694 RepID=A0A398CR24_9BACL|nr:hypothetical protein D3H35_16255 [Cohnella faecalis]